MKDLDLLFAARMLFKTRVGQSVPCQSKIVEMVLRALPSQIFSRPLIMTFYQARAIDSKLSELRTKGNDTYNCGLYILAEIITVSVYPPCLSVRRAYTMQVPG